MPDSVPTPSLTSLLIEPDYVLVRMALVREVGLEAAVVLQRIHWRCDVRPDGWKISHEDLASELHLTVYAVRKATKVLRDKGWLLHSRSSSWDPTPIWSLPDLWTTQPEPENSTSRDVENEHHEVVESKHHETLRIITTQMMESVDDEEREQLGRAASRRLSSFNNGHPYCELHLFPDPCSGCAADRKAAR